MSYCPIHGSYYDYSNSGCRECQLAEEELKSLVALAAYKSANPGDYECPHCLYRSLKLGASRCPLCHGEVGRDYWNAEAERLEAQKATNAAAEREVVVAKQKAAAAEQAAFERATWWIRLRLLAIALVVAGLWWGLAQYEAWLPAGHPKFLSATLAVLAQYEGATFGATMVFIGLALLVPRLSRGGVAALALLFLAAFELSQLHGTRWLDDVRVTRLGGLLLGHGFRWNHLLCYTIGVLPLADDEEGIAFLRLAVTLLCSGALVGLWQFAWR